MEEQAAARSGHIARQRSVQDSPTTASGRACAELSLPTKGTRFIAGIAEAPGRTQARRRQARRARGRQCPPRSTIGSTIQPRVGTLPSPSASSTRSTSVSSPDPWIEAQLLCVRLLDAAIRRLHRSDLRDDRADSLVTMTYGSHEHGDSGHTAVPSHGTIGVGDARLGSASRLSDPRATCPRNGCLRLKTGGATGFRSYKYPYQASSWARGDLNSGQSRYPQSAPVQEIHI